MILYHGTNKKFDKFKKDSIGSNTEVTSVGFFFTDNINTAKSYGSTVLKCEVDLGAYIECDFNGDSTYYFGEEKWYTPNMLAERIDEINKDMENHMSIEIGDYGESEIDYENSTDDELVYLYDNSNFTPEDYLDMLGEGGGFDHQCDDKIDSVICKNVKDNMELGGELCNNYIIFDEDKIKIMGLVMENSCEKYNGKKSSLVKLAEDLDYYADLIEAELEEMSVKTSFDFKPIYMDRKSQELYSNYFVDFITPNFFAVMKETKYRDENSADKFKCSIEFQKGAMSIRDYNPRKAEVFRGMQRTLADMRSANKWLANQIKENFGFVLKGGLTFG